ERSRGGPRVGWGLPGGVGGGETGRPPVKPRPPAGIRNGRAAVAAAVPTPAVPRPAARFPRKGPTMDQQDLPEYSGPADFARWADEHFEQLLAGAAAFFPDSLR